MKKRQGKSSAYRLAIICSLCIYLLCGCQKKSYADDRTARELADVAIADLQTQMLYLEAEPNVLDGYFPLPDSVTDATVRFSADGNDLDEFGIYHIKDGNPSELASLLQGYLSSFYETYNANYLPEEIPKLRDAEVKVFGNYVAYAMLAEPYRTQFFQSIDHALQVKK